MTINVPVQVLHTLSKLSWTPRATAKCSVGFPAARNRPSQDEEQIYRALEDLVTEDQYADFYYKHLGGGNFGRRTSNYFAGTDKEEDIYEDLCSFNSQNKLLQVRKASSLYDVLILRILCFSERNSQFAT